MPKENHQWGEKHYAVTLYDIDNIYFTNIFFRAIRNKKLLISIDTLNCSVKN